MCNCAAALSRPRRRRHAAACAAAVSPGIPCPRRRWPRGATHQPACAPARHCARRPPIGRRSGRADV